MERLALTNRLCLQAKPASTCLHVNMSSFNYNCSQLNGLEPLCLHNPTALVWANKQVVSFRQMLMFSHINQAAEFTMRQLMLFWVLLQDSLRVAAGRTWRTTEKTWPMAVRKLDNTKSRSHEVCVVNWFSLMNNVSLLCPGEYFKKCSVFETHLALISYYDFSNIGKSVAFSMSRSLVSACLHSCEIRRSPQPTLWKIPFPQSWQSEQEPESQPHRSPLPWQRIASSEPLSRSRS